MASNTSPSETWRTFPLVVGALGGIVFASAGLWAMVDPASFFDVAATFEPFNRHFIQDIGAFQIGLGAVLLLAAQPGRLDGLAVGLLGVGIGSAAHVVSHLVGRDLGGNPATDIPLLTLLSLLLLGAGVARLRRP